MATTSSMKDISHENDANSIERSEHKQEKSKSRSVEEKSRWRKGDNIPLIYAVVPHLAQAAKATKRNIRKNTEGDDQRKKEKSYDRKSSGKRRRGSSKTILYNQPRTTISMGNPTKDNWIWE